MPGESKPIRLSSKWNVKGYGFFGSFENGECGIIIKSVKAINEGIVTCSLDPADNKQEFKAETELIIAKEPIAAHIRINNDQKIILDGMEESKVQASCIVQEGRPVAEIAWYLDNMKLENAITIVSDSIVDNLVVWTVRSDLPMILDKRDKGKHLICNVTHEGYPQGFSTIQKELDFEIIDGKLRSQKFCAHN